MKFRFLWIMVLFWSLSATGIFAQEGAGSALGGIRTPLFLGGALGFGSGTGVGGF